MLESNARANSRTKAVATLGAKAARFAPDRIVIKELPLLLRGRLPGEVPALIERALLAAGVAPERIHVEPDEETAARLLLDAAQPGDQHDREKAREREALCI